MLKRSWRGRVMCASRNYAIMSVLVFTGMRRGEVMGLRIGDISLAERAIRVRGKGGKMRVIPLVDRAVEGTTTR